jgi:hypothetical protein
MRRDNSTHSFSKGFCKGDTFPLNNNVEVLVAYCPATQQVAPTPTNYEYTLPALDSNLNCTLNC